MEAISPTPDDQPCSSTSATSSSSNSKPIAEKLEKVERDIKHIESRIKHFEKVQQQLEAEATSGSTCAQSTGRGLLAASDNSIESAVARINAENRRKAALSHAEFGDRLRLPVDLYASAPLVVDPMTAPGVAEFYERHRAFKPQLIAHIRAQSEAQERRVRYLSDRYDCLRAVWLEKVERWEAKPTKKAKDEKYRDVFERTFPELRRQREEKERDSR